MEYAVQTRDYNHDYRWSWEESGSDSLRAKVSLELQNLIETETDPEKKLELMVEQAEKSKNFAQKTKRRGRKSRALYGLAIISWIVFVSFWQKQRLKV